MHHRQCPIGAGVAFAATVMPLLPWRSAYYRLHRAPDEDAPRQYRSLDRSAYWPSQYRETAPRAGIIGEAAIASLVVSIAAPRQDRCSRPASTPLPRPPCTAAPLANIPPPASLASTARLRRLDGAYLSSVRVNGIPRTIPGLRLPPHARSGKSIQTEYQYPTRSSCQIRDPRWPACRDRSYTKLQTAHYHPEPALAKAGPGIEWDA